MESSKSNDEIIADFQKKRMRQILALVPVVLAFIGLISVEGKSGGLFGLSPTLTMGISFMLIIGVLIFSLLNWRCPSCNRYLGKAFNPKFCSKCGVQLR